MTRHVSRRVTAASGPAIAIALAIAVTLAACGGGGGGRATETGGERCPLAALRVAHKPVEITFWNAILTDSNQALLRRLVDEFHARQQDVRVHLVQQPDLSETFVKYKAGLTSGDLPDLVQLGETSVQTMVDSRSTVPIQACVDADHYSLSDYLPATVGFYTTRSVLRAMPWTVSNPVLFYDRNAFRRAGLDPNRPPRTFDEVRAYSRAIVASGAAKHGIALPAQSFYTEYWFAKAGQLYVDRGGGRTARAEHTFLDSATGLAIFRWWKDMVDSGLMLDTGRAAGNYDHLFALGTGEAAMTMEASSGLGPIFGILGQGQFSGVDLGVGRMPAPRADGGIPPGDSALWIPSHSSPAKQAAAWQFVKFLNEPEQQAALHVGAGYIPIRKSAVNLPAVRDLWRARPAFRVPYDQLLAGRRTAASNGSVIGDYDRVRGVVGDALTAMLTQGLSPEAAVRRARRDADAVIAEYNSRVR